MFSFEKLDAWNVAIDFAHSVYQATSRFPADERFGLTSQLRRSATSISANVAEGSGRASKKDVGRFIEIAFGSLLETVSHLALAQRRKYLGNDEYRSLYKSADRLGRILSGLKRSVKEDG